MPAAEAGWTSLLPTPNHPQFPSAHGCLTGSFVNAVATLMGTDEIGLDIDAVNIGVSRHYTTRSDVLTEVGEARIWAGLHDRFSTETGLRLAQRLVTFNLSRNFQPVR